MNSIDKSNRRVDVSANISDYVYEYEKDYTVRSSSSETEATSRE